MSMYQDGAGANISGSPENALLNSYNDQLAVDLKAVARGFPKSFTAAQAITQLKSAVAYGKKQLDRHKGTLSDWVLSIVGRPANTKGLEIAIKAAETAAKAWQSRITETYVYNQNKNKEWQDLNTRVMTVYVEVAGLVGERVSLNAAKKELTKDLNPVAPTNIAKYLVIGGVVFFGYRVITGMTKGKGNSGE